MARTASELLQQLSILRIRRQALEDQADRHNRQLGWLRQVLSHVEAEIEEANTTDEIDEARRQEKIALERRNEMIQVLIQDRSDLESARVQIDEIEQE